MKQRTAIVIGAGPAGLTAAYELLQRSDIKPIVLEATGIIGGISCTVNHNGNRIDIGGHRFFSKSDRVMGWWHDMVPHQGAPARDDLILGRELQFGDGPDPEKEDLVMLSRNRLSRILFGGKLYDYPLSLSPATLSNLGAARVVKIGASYLRSRLFPIRAERSLEDFYVNRFGRELYKTFFENYTEKVWGIPCRGISPEWGAQRVKGLSILSAVLHALRRIVKPGSDASDREIETTLIGRFHYPKLGPGQLWEEVARRVRECGGSVLLNHRVTGVECNDGRIVSVRATDGRSGREVVLGADYVFSSMPVRDLIASMADAPPAKVREVAGGLLYRDFVMVGILADTMLRGESGPVFPGVKLVRDNWIYVQEPAVNMGRIQVYNNWSPYMVAGNKVWLGLEYFCNEGDALWSRHDPDMARMAVSELGAVKLVSPDVVRDHAVIRMPKAYPAYFGTYGEFDRIREYVDTIANLFLVGRNGMHKYNNMDHSMLTAMRAVDSILEGSTGRDQIWAVNTDDNYAEAK